MFLKIVTYKVGPNEEDRETIEAVYECKSYRKISGDQDIIFILDDSRKVGIKGEEKTTIYITNDDGKTIDKICWKHK